MRTTLDLPQELIEQALKVTKEKTKTSLIIKALEEFIRKRELTKLKKYQGKIDLPIHLDTLRKRG